MTVHAARYSPAAHGTMNRSPGMWRVPMAVLTQRMRICPPPAPSTCRATGQPCSGLTFKVACVSRADFIASGFGNYLLIFQVSDEGPVVLRVLHSGQDIEQAFGVV